MNADYNQYPYPTRAQPQLHVENLFVTARLQGLQAVAVEKARVLEIGCGDGMNLIPMACRLPEATFVGVDYARAPTEAAREIASNLGLSNFRCHHADISELADDFGEFDYILAHGFYSWVPDTVRKHFWRVVSGSLSPRGLLFVSYNLLPGWRQTAMLRDFVQLEKRRLGGRESWQQEAWQRVQELAALQESRHPLAIEAARSVAKGLETAIHDEFEPETRPFLFREVLDAAGGAGFRYVGDAIRKVRSGLQVAPAVSAFLDEDCEGEELLREEYLDMMTMRPFRQSVFARAGHEPDKLSLRERMAPLCMTTAVVPAHDDLRKAGSRRDGSDVAQGHRYRPQPGADLEQEFGFESDDRFLERLVQWLTASAPERVPVGKTLEVLRDELKPIAEKEWQDFEELFAELVMAGVFPLYASHMRLPAEADLTSESRPMVGALNRLEAARGREISSREHKTQALRDPLHRAMLLLLDGQRSLVDVVAALKEVLHRELRGDGPALPVVGAPVMLRDSAAFRDELSSLSPERLGEILEALVHSEVRRLRQLAILEAPHQP